MDILQKKTPGLETPFYALEKEKLLTTNITKTIILYFYFFSAAKLRLLFETHFILCYNYFCICFKPQKCVIFSLKCVI